MDIEAEVKSGKQPLVMKGFILCKVIGITTKGNASLVSVNGGHHFESEWCNLEPAKDGYVPGLYVIERNELGDDVNPSYWDGRQFSSYCKTKTRHIPEGGLLMVNLTEFDRIVRVGDAPPSAIFKQPTPSISVQEEYAT